jgi:glycosyltransferase involved in cell wall biosynthesis
MRILQLSPQFAYPLENGGKISIMNTSRAFHLAGIEVHQLCYASTPPDADLLKSAVEYSGATIDIVLHSTKNTIPRMLYSIFNEQSLYISKHRSQAMILKLQELAENSNFDIIHADHTAMFEMGKIAAKIFNAPLGLRLHNVECKIWERYAARIPAYLPQHWYIKRQAKLLKQFEADHLKLADICFAITQDDADYALKLSPGSKVSSVGVGVDTDYLKPDPSLQRIPHAMIHATTYGWRHNLEGLEWFFLNVMPGIRKKHPKAYLELLGKGAPESYKLLQDKGIITAGFVPQIQPYFSKAGFYIAPLFVGSGVRIKILEAMAMELPVIATPVAAEGIPAGREQGLIICKDAEEFVKEACYLIENKEYTRSIGVAARAYIQANHSWPEIASMMLQEYNLLLQSGLYKSKSHP